MEPAAGAVTLSVEAASWSAALTASWKEEEMNLNSSSTRCLGGSIA